MTIHVVSPGETVDSIAAKYGVAPKQLAADNDLPPGLALAVGQTLVVRFPREIHVVTRGETLTSIAERYGTSVRQLWRNNWSLGGGADLTAGQLLVVSYFGEKIGEGVFNGYAYPFISPELLAEQLPYLSAMAPFTYGITAEGGLLPLDDEAMLEAARARGTKPVMHLSTLTEAGQFDTGRATFVLTDYEVQGRLAAEVLQTVLRKDFAGLDVDFEYLPGQLAGAYAAFLGRLRQLLAAQGRFLWAALAPKTSTRQRGLLYEGHDYAAVAAAVDGVLLMTYEWGYTYGPPMAVAPLPNVRAVLDYAVTQMPAGKIFLGVPNYGYDWPLPFIQGETRAQSISNQRAIELAVQYGEPIQYDETAQSPFFHYTDAGGTAHEVWFEDARSMDAKLRLVAEYGFQGAGFWNLMRPFSQVWLVLDSLYDIE
ncbi:LysM peptidoglycan-binding domain-containing protein [uncultured Oscillibacter sp.]|jgi:spore germination protein|uniref:LysM peptidoglycan-binding domain-containing protein n=1 Tax=uncultured Oscillibacter sp. TaxID=876091 RepID=UPI002173BD84|nr:LysM peptidoglycan-binding domain-containing protein [uncultured Oscillibacter sp.]MCI9554084.1 LysM peptidoglycan-binding domain-containing protein [Oscillibacter sp.]